MSTTKKIIIAAVIVALLIGGFFLYKKFGPDKNKAQLESLQSKLASENYKLFNLNKLATRTTGKPADIEKQIEAQKLVVAGLEAQIKELKGI